MYALDAVSNDGHADLATSLLRGSRISDVSVAADSETMTDTQFFSPPTGSGHRLAYVQRNANAASLAAPGVMWLGGFKSDMTGSKAIALDEWAQRMGRAFLRFDYSGHGVSGGAFVDGSISAWAADAKAVFDHLTQGPLILVGSSMGGWISCLLAKAHLAETGEGSRIAGLVLIAPALDFTEELMWSQMDEATRACIMTEGYFEKPSAYSDDPYIITKKLIEDGRENLLLGGEVHTGCPVHILQGQRDDDVPWMHAIRTVERIARDDVTLTLVKDGDHRLSTEADLERMILAVERLVPLQQVGG